MSGLPRSAPSHTIRGPRRMGRADTPRRRVHPFRVGAAHWTSHRKSFPASGCEVTFPPLTCCAGGFRGLARGRQRTLPAQESSPSAWPLIPTNDGACGDYAENQVRKKASELQHARCHAARVALRALASSAPSPPASAPCGRWNHLSLHAHSLAAPRIRPKRTKRPRPSRKSRTSTSLPTARSDRSGEGRQSQTPAWRARRSPPPG